MEKNYPSSSKVVVIVGGVIGCSVAYHLTKFGWSDVVLLERDQLTSGTTWHAAGLVSQLGPSAAVTKIRKYTLDLYKKLEKEIDHSAGLRLNGALSIAQTDSRWQELKRQATTAQLYDVDINILDKDEIKKKLENRLLELQNQIDLKGFRKGKVPPMVIKNQFGKAIYGEVIDKVLKESTTKAIQDKKLKVVLKSYDLDIIKKIKHIKGPQSFKTQGVSVTFSYKLICNKIPAYSEKEDVSLLVLDQIEDPQNFGQIVRTV